MSDVALPGSIEPAARKGPDLSGAINPLTAILFGGVLAAMVLYVAYSIYNDIGESGTNVTSYAPFLLLFVALLIALGFEFVSFLRMRAPKLPSRRQGRSSATRSREQRSELPDRHHPSVWKRCQR